MSAEIQPTDVRSKALQDEFTGHPMPARPRARVSSSLILSSGAKPILVERLRKRSWIRISSDARTEQGN